jgi:Ca2+-binding RTX toxin-like protein
VRGYFDQATGGFINAIVFADGTQLGLADIVTRINTVVSVGTAGADTLTGRAFDDLLQGLGGDDLLSGGVGNDTLLGGDGNDTLNGDVGNDVLTDTSGNNLLQGGWGDDHYTGGSGNDVFRDEGGLQTVGTGKAAQTVWSESGSDTYTLQAGFGHDSLYEANYVTSPYYQQVSPYGTKGNDVVEFGAGILASDLVVERGVGSPTAVRIRSRVSGDTLDIVTGDIETFKFADGTQWVWSDVLEKFRQSQSQTITGTTGKDSLVGGIGDDTISGLAGNDTLSGGVGNDRLIGGKGNDTYLFQRGGGQDVILDQDSTLFNSDLLKVGDASSSQLWLTRSGNNLDISVIGTTDKVTIEGWYASSANRIEKITALGDNKSLSYSKVNALVTAMATFAPPAQGQTTLPANVQASLSKVLASSWV